MNTFSAELRRAMAARGMTCRSLAEAIGCASATIGSARKPTWRPNQQLAVAMAEVLDWDGLVGLSLKANTRECGYCGKAFVLQRMPARFCSKRCRENVWQSRARYPQKKAERLRSRKLLDARLTLYQQAVAAFCKGCEPEGLCRDAGCALRPCSPLPLVRVRAA